jgi:hypothetical protein
MPLYVLQFISSSAKVSKQPESGREHAVQLRDLEHNGRMNNERELRRVVAAKMHDGDALYYSPIGHVSSCFERCLGSDKVVYPYPTHC